MYFLWLLNTLLYVFHRKQKESVKQTYLDVPHRPCRVFGNSLLVKSKNSE